MVIVLPLATPLCPAGHLPHKGGDWMGPMPCLKSRHKSAVTNLKSALSAPRTINAWRRSGVLPISPLVGEMPGRAEGGAPRTRSVRS
ncbi:Hypothetical protein NGAL_HAMBI2566_36150 [Neorhizobium galegae bv. orientalis]|nr:Hypothetical protein NGAL_HAMBI2566_36150 [Neorhizobium galegae bv. orientalis]